MPDMPVRAVVTDIEGTTSSLSFVKDVLFPYARKHLATYVRQHAADAAVQQQLRAVSELVGAELDQDAAIEQLLRWIDEDKKATPLKALQGMIWEAGYRHGDFTGHVYADAEQALRRWHASGLPLYVYSSGSVYAQKLLYAHSDYGDLTPLFSGYFDTTTGAKVDSESYRRIAGSMGLPAAEILFLSDIEAELNAAREAGMQTCWLVRDREPDAAASHTQVRDFAAISTGSVSRAETSGRRV